MNNATITQDKIELNEQILFANNESLFVGRIVEIREKAVKVDYTFESVWGKASMLTTFNYTTWIPKSVIVNDNIGGLSVKAWFKNYGFNNSKKYTIKAYYISNGQQIFA